MQKMLQQVMTAPGHIEFREAPVPAPNAGEVLVKIMKIGVCGSDIHVYHGEHPFTKYPVTQGHEVSGKIAALGEGVTGFAVGQKVTIEPQVYCGRCHPCTHGKYNLCEELRVMGFQTTGTASEYFAVDAGKVTPLPETMTYSEGAMIEPLAARGSSGPRIRCSSLQTLNRSPVVIRLPGFRLLPFLSFQKGRCGHLHRRGPFFMTAGHYALTIAFEPPRPSF